MKKLILFSWLLTSSLILKSQTFTSNKIRFAFPEQNITIMNDKGNVLFTVPCNFKRNAMLKAKVKTLKVGDKRYLIKKEKRGKQNVYTQDWELVAKMDKHGKSILLVHKKNHFKLIQDKNWFSPLKRVYSNEKGEKVIHCSIKNKKYSIDSLLEKNEQTNLLMALSLHQFLEAKAREANAREAASQNLFSDL